MANNEYKEENYQQQRRRPSFLRVLKRLQNETKQVTLIIKSGSNCCEITGCIANIVDNSYIVLLNNNNDCTRSFVRLDCICAVQVPGEDVNKV